MPGKRRVLPRWMVSERHSSRQTRLFVYGLNRDAFIRRQTDASIAASAPPITFDDLPTEIMVKILNYVLLANDNDYNCALPCVCSRWTRLMYHFVYVNGFRIEDYEDLLVNQLSLFAHMMGESNYNAVVGERVVKNILYRYRIALHPRVVTYTIMRAAPKAGCEYSIYAAKTVQHFCFGQF